MEVSFRENLSLTIYGFSGVDTKNNPAALAFALSGRMWQLVKEKGIANEGKNVWVYEPGHVVFAGVVLVEPVSPHGLEKKSLLLKKYVYYKHVGPYSQIKVAGLRMQEEIKKKGYAAVLPSIEIYGHWTGDEAKSETELLMAIQEY